MISIKQASKVFDSKGIAGLHGINLDIPKGQILALMGPNGSGKSTLLNVLLGKVALDSGSFQLKGSAHLLEKRNPLHDLNVQQFLVDAVLGEIPADKKKQLTRDFADVFEFTFQLKQSIGQLSQGQLQKVLLSRELMNQPDILLLDEPFVHLDPMTRKDILESLFHYLKQRETTVIWITHEKDEALRFSDQVALIQHGHIEQVSSAFDILHSPRNLFVAQFFGHQNFLKVSRCDHGFQTMWGEIESSLKDPEAYLVIPPTSWIVDESSPMETTILRRCPQYFSSECEVDYQEKTFKISLPLRSFQDLKVGSFLKLRPKLAECFLLPL